MPFKSQAQRRYMYKHLPEIAAKWEKYTKNKKLPKRIGKKGKTSSAMRTRRLRRRLS
jgi:5-bromo-4-chloroindolyl phosphate hydrolysis protein